MTTTGRDRPADWVPVVADLEKNVGAAGLDLVAPLQVGWYNDCVAADNRLPDFDDPASLAMLVGNTRRLWPQLVATLARRVELLELRDPVDAYVEESVLRAVSQLPVPAQLRWAHRPQPHHIAMQKLAAIAGVAWRSPVGLSIHPVYGSWIGLRAVVVLPVSGPSRRPEPPAPCRYCESGCLAAASTAGNVWREQLAVRDACPVGRRYRYSDMQIMYHYTKSRDLLRSAVRKAADSG